MTTSYRKLTSKSFPLILTFFIAYFSIWSLANWPALWRAWWYSDDFTIADDVTFNGPYPNGIRNGRLFEGLWNTTFLLDGGPDKGLSNICLHLIQGALHSLAAAIAAVMFWKETGRLRVFFFVLPFLVWPFNADAVLWRSAGQYPIAALFGLIGVWAIYKEGSVKSLSNLLGVLCIASAMLTNQLGALSGLVIWTILIITNLLKNKTFLLENRKKLYQTLLVITGYIIGGALSLVISSESDQRATLTVEFLKKLQFFIHLNYKAFFSQPNYQFWLPIIIFFLFLSSAIVTLIQTIHKEWSIKKFIIFILIILLALTSPYITLLMTSEDWFAWRKLYLSPFLITGALILLDQGIGHKRIGIILQSLILAIIMTGYFRISLINSSEYLELFEKDLKVLYKIEQISSDLNSSGTIFISSYPDFIRTRNPQNLKYGYKESVFLWSHTSRPFIRWFSKLTLAEDSDTKRECLLTCKNSIEGKSFQIYKLQNSNSLCVCP